VGCICGLGRNLKKNSKIVFFPSFACCKGWIQKDNLNDSKPEFWIFSKIEVWIMSQGFETNGFELKV
jgi:hypothetical protein